MARRIRKNCEQVRVKVMLRGRSRDKKANGGYILRDRILARIFEMTMVGNVLETTRPYLALHFGVKPPRISALIKELRRMRLIWRRKGRIENIGRVQRYFIPSPAGEEAAKK